MDEQSNNPTKENIWPEWVQKAEASLGRGYAPEFIEVLADQGFEVLLNWLKVNHIPEEVVDLYQHIWMLKTYLEWSRNGELEDAGAQDLAQIIPPVTEIIAKLGGFFEYSGYYSNLRENVITLQPAPSASPALQE